MRWLFLFIVAVHGMIHFMGPAKAFGLADLPQLTVPISRGLGLAWLAAGVLVIAAAVTFVTWPRGWWMVGVAAAVLSQAVIVTSWTDVKAGTLANVLLLAGAVYGLAAAGPGSFRAAYERDAADVLARPVAAAAVTEGDLQPLPAPVQRYLREVGVVGQPRMENYRLRFRGRIRSGPAARWMPFTVEQTSAAPTATRLFLMRATLFGVPIHGYHRLAAGHATMHVKALGLVTVAQAAGPEMDQAETVTLFNDMCLLAPASLLSPSVTWEAIDDRSARGWLTHSGHRISAVLTFGDDGLITDFVSDDRLALGADGRSFSRWRFSTPVKEYRQYGPYRLAGRVEALWHAPAGAYAYGEFELLDAQFNVGRP